MFRHAARVAVRTRDGRTFQELLLDRRGSPENPLSPAEIETKFRSVVGSCISTSDADRIVNLVGTLEQLPNLSPLIAAIAGPSSLCAGRRVMWRASMNTG